MVVNLVDLLFAFLVFVPLLIYFHVTPNIYSIFPILLGLFILATLSLGIGTLLAPLTLKYRDVSFLIPYFIQIGLFLTPVIYPRSISHSQYQLIFDLNPLTSVIEYCRISLFGKSLTSPDTLIYPLILGMFCLWIGIKFFTKSEKNLADIV